MKKLSTLLLAAFISAFAFAAAPAAVKLDLTTGTAKDKEAMVYSKDKMTVKAGAKVTLTFKNGAKDKSMTHNWVLAKPGKGAAVQEASISAGPDKGWVADSADVLVKSKLIGGGESEVIEFTAPTEPADYSYICTFPGHTTMKGTLKVTK